MVLLIVGIDGYSRILSKQIYFAETEGANSPGFKSADLQGNIFGALTYIIVLAITFMMVVKPRLW